MFSTFDLSTVNSIAVLLATVAYFFIGFLWFSKLMFARAWMASLNLKPENMDKSGLGKIMTISFLATLVICFALHVVISLIGITAVSAAVKLGLLAGLGFVASTQLINSLYESRPMTLVLINSGYHVTGFVVAAVVITLVR